METIRIVTDVSQYVGCGGLMPMSQDALQYILEHGALETTIAGRWWCVYARREKNPLAEPSANAR